MTNDYLINGYRAVYQPGHPKPVARGFVYEHVLMAEAALGKNLPPGAEMHHVNGDKADNRPQNLVVCQDRAYHMLLHQRQRALAECGHAGWHRCDRCKGYDAPGLDVWVLNFSKSGTQRHRVCHAAYERNRRTLMAQEG